MKMGLFYRRQNVEYRYTAMPGWKIMRYSSGKCDAPSCRYDSPLGRRGSYGRRPISKSTTLKRCYVADPVKRHGCYFCRYVRCAANDPNYSKSSFSADVKKAILAKKKETFRRPSATLISKTFCTVAREQQSVSNSQKLKCTLKDDLNDDTKDDSTTLYHADPDIAEPAFTVNATIDTSMPDKRKGNKITAKDISTRVGTTGYEKQEYLQPQDLKSLSLRDVNANTTPDCFDDRFSKPVTKVMDLPRLSTPRFPPVPRLPPILKQENTAAQGKQTSTPRERLENLLLESNQVTPLALSRRATPKTESPTFSIGKLTPRSIPQVTLTHTPQSEIITQSLQPSGTTPEPDRDSPTTSPLSDSEGEDSKSEIGSLPSYSKGDASKNEIASQFSEDSSTKSVASGSPMYCLRSLCGDSDRVDPSCGATIYSGNPLYRERSTYGDAETVSVMSDDVHNNDISRNTETSNYRKLYVIEFLILLIIGGLLTVGLIPYIESEIRAYMTSVCRCSMGDKGMVLTSGPQMTTDGLTTGVVQWLTCPLEESRAKLTNME